MNTTRALLAGSMVWAYAITSFSVLSLLPGLQGSEAKQALIVGIFMVPVSYLSSAFYYKKGAKGQGIWVGAIMSATALVLDALITVPFVEIPMNGSYARFFTNPLLWGLVSLNITVVFFYWKTKVKTVAVS